MTQRWEQRRAEARARWSDKPVSDRPDPSGVRRASSRLEPPPLPLSALSVTTPPTLDVLENTRSTRRKGHTGSSPNTGTGSVSAVSPAPVEPAPTFQALRHEGPVLLRDSQRAMIIVALVANSVLLALLYFGGFLD
jgi:hypothetical protein